MLAAVLVPFTPAGSSVWTQMPPGRTAVWNGSAGRVASEWSRSSAIIVAASILASFADNTAQERLRRIAPLPTDLSDALLKASAKLNRSPVGYHQPAAAAACSASGDKRSQSVSRL